MDKKSTLDPFLWSSLILILSTALALHAAFREKGYFEEYQITSPELPLEFALIYFFAVVVVMGIVLFFIPFSKLAIVFRVLFTFLYAWGMFMVFALTLPFPVAIIVSVAGSLAWLFVPKIWLHNLLLLLTLAGAGSVFGFLFVPWTFMAFMLVI